MELPVATPYLAIIHRQSGRFVHHVLAARNDEEFEQKIEKILAKNNNMDADCVDRYRLSTLSDFSRVSTSTHRRMVKAMQAYLAGLYPAYLGATDLSACVPNGLCLKHDPVSRTISLAILNNPTITVSFRRKGQPVLSVVEPDFELEELKLLQILARFAENIAEGRQSQLVLDQTNLKETMEDARKVNQRINLHHL